MDDNLADYRRFCANRLRRLERCKKTKSFCNLDDDVLPAADSGSENIRLKTDNFAACTSSSSTFSGEPCVAVMDLCSRTSTVESRAVPLATKLWPRNENSATPVTAAPASVHNGNNFCSSGDGGDPGLLSPPLSCSSSTSPVSLCSLSVPSSLSLLSTVMATTTTNVESGIENNYADNSGRIRAQKKFDLLREKMVNFHILSYFSLKKSLLLLKKCYKLPLDDETIEKTVVKHQKDKMLRSCDRSGPR